MKVILPKLQDDIYTKKGKAEKHLRFDAKFDLAFRNLGAKKSDLTALDPEKIIAKYGLRGFVFGNYVTQEERYFFLLKISKQLELLAKIKGSNKLADGDLVIAFGSQGISRANAHFNARDMLINLNRGRKTNYKEDLKGDGSFIHEYAHYIDFKKGRRSIVHGYNFESESDHKNNNFHGLIKELRKDPEYIFGISHSKYLMSDIEIFARAFESTISYMVAKRKMTGFRNYVRSYILSPFYPTNKMIVKYDLEKYVTRILKTKL